MPPDTVQRHERLKAIRSLLLRERVRGQDELRERLRALGYRVGQSCVSRDLRELGVAKVQGEYRVQPPSPEPPAEPAPEQVLRNSILDFAPAGPHLLVVHTVTGGASRVGLLVDRAAWPEVVGTVAGDDTLFIATLGRRGQGQVRLRLQALLEEKEEHE